MNDRYLHNLAQLRKCAWAHIMLDSNNSMHRTHPNEHSKFLRRYVTIQIFTVSTVCRMENSISRAFNELYSVMTEMMVMQTKEKSASNRWNWFFPPLWQSSYAMPSMVLCCLIKRCDDHCHKDVYLTFGWGRFDCLFIACAINVFMCCMNGLSRAWFVHISQQSNERLPEFMTPLGMDMKAVNCDTL